MIIGFSQEVNMICQRCELQTQCQQVVGIDGYEKWFSPIFKGEEDYAGECKAPTSPAECNGFELQDSYCNVCGAVIAGHGCECGAN